MINQGKQLAGLSHKLLLFTGYSYVNSKENLEETSVSASWYNGNSNENLKETSLSVSEYYIKAGEFKMLQH